MRRGQFHEALRATGVFRDEFLTALENAESLRHGNRIADTAVRGLSTAALRPPRWHSSVAASVGIWILVAALLIVMIFYLFFSLYMKPYREALEMLSLAALDRAGHLR